MELHRRLGIRWEVLNCAVVDCIGTAMYLRKVHSGVGRGIKMEVSGVTYTVVVSYLEKLGGRW